MISSSYVLILFTVIIDAWGRRQLQDIVVPDRNPGDPYGFFVYSMPDLYRNATVGPDVWRWLADRFGAAHLSRGGVRRAPSNSHICADRNGWCRERCRDTENIGWKYKDICGAYYCCLLKLQ